MHNSQRSLLDLAREDLATARKRDPAARSSVEVALLYPGVHALWAHRAAHKLWHKGYRFAARACLKRPANFTGIEIHPAATIGERFFIDHGMGVVIGETAEVGNDVLLFHGVTLGGWSMSPGQAPPHHRLTTCRSAPAQGPGAGHRRGRGQGGGQRGPGEEPPAGSCCRGRAQPARDPAPTPSS